MSLIDNREYINLRSETRHGTLDLEVKVKDKDLIAVKTNIETECGRHDLIFTIEEIEALYHFAQILKLNK